MKHKKQNSKSGFTLIELLVAMAVIAALTALLTTVVGTMVTTARTKATQVTILKIHGLMQQRTQGYNRYIEEQDAFSTPPFYAENDTGEEILRGRLKVFRKLFPQLLNEEDLPEINEDIPPFNPVMDDKLSSKMLYYFLITQKPAISGIPKGEADQFVSSEIKIGTDNNPYFIDSWGNPLRFYRWPTRLIKPDETPLSSPFDPATSPILNKGAISLLTRALPSRDLSNLPENLLNQDPNDPVGLYGSFINEIDYYTINTWHTPLIVSAGPSGKLGLYEPYDETNFGHLAQPKPDLNLSDQWENVYDNISNHNFARGDN